MFIERIEIPRYKVDGTRSQQIRVITRYQCDHCKTIYERGARKPHHSKSNLHFCSNECKHLAHRKGNSLHAEVEKTCIEKYGDAIPMRTEAVKAKRIETLRARYSVNSPMCVPGAKEKRRQTHLERYGVEDTFQNPAFVEQRRKTWFKNYGVPHVPQTEEIKNKILATIARSPQKWSSKIEDEFYQLLCERFGSEHVVRQKRVHRWPIDFYVSVVNTYVQLDGVYWHGLDRPIEFIRESQRPRDQAIAEKWANDREQEKWFAEKRLNLVRVTDVDVKQGIALSKIESHASQMPLSLVERVESPE